jgi:hypothetical protein
MRFIALAFVCACSRGPAPEVAFAQLKAAACRGDDVAVFAAIDEPAVRSHLKPDVAAKMKSLPPMTATEKAATTTMVNDVADELVTASLNATHAEIAVSKGESAYCTMTLLGVKRSGTDATLDVKTTAHGVNDPKPGGPWHMTLRNGRWIVTELHSARE